MRWTESLPLPEPSRRDLLVFGVLLAAFAGLAGVVLDARWDAPVAARAVWAAGAALCGAFFLAPGLRRPLYRGWMLAAYPIGWLVSRVLLAVIYYGVVTPVGLALRWSGRSSVERRVDRSAATYWTDHLPRKNSGEYFRPF